MVQKSKNRPKYPTPPNRSKVFSEEQAPHFLLPDPTSDALPSSLPPRNSTTKTPTEILFWFTYPTILMRIE